MIDLKLGDCLDVLKTLATGSVDAICTDPPAGISFMGRDFDNPSTYQSNKAKVRDRFLDFLTPRLAECLRVARPGARMLCWAIPRTSHWTGMAVEEAGWIIESKVYHLFGTGFPKAKSQLKPAAEEWILARAPGGKVPALEIDRCRIGLAGKQQHWDRYAPSAKIGYGGGEGSRDGEAYNPAGRYPANLILSHIGGPDGCREVGTRRVKASVAASGPTLTGESTSNSRGKFNGVASTPCYADPDGRETVAAWECVDGCPIRQLDEQTGTLKSGHLKPSHTDRGKTEGRYGAFEGREITQDYGGDSGGPSRFFATFGYFPKASRSDRGESNTHPTCKNTDLMSWLARLITPAGGTVLDPFLGSGSTGVACIREGLNFIGIEQDPAYMAIAWSRINEARASAPLFAAIAP